MVERFEQFSYEIFSIYRHIMKIEREEMERYGLKGSYTTYLAAMYRFPEGITSAKLAELCDRDKAGISRTVNEMEQRGLIERKNIKDNFYRANLVLTDEGRRAAEFVLNRAGIAVGEAGAGLSDSDREIFYRSLALIESNLRKISKEGISHIGDNKGEL